MDVVLLFPGQGSQRPGMGQDVAAAFPAARSVFSAADEALGYPLSDLCFSGPAATLGLTQHAQPALLTHSAAVCAVVYEQLQSRVRAAAGHSLGEFSAYLAAGAMGFAQAVSLVKRRGELMLAATDARPGSMAAILGDDVRVDDLCASASAAPDGGLVVPANFNSPGQVVISGEVAGVRKAVELAPAFGAKHTIPLAVSGAFHSPLMEPAREGLEVAISDTPFVDPQFPVYANVTGLPVCDAPKARRLLLDQLTGAVRWAETVKGMAAEFPSALFVEIGTGNVLTKLVRKIAPDVTAMTCGTAAEVEQLQARIA